MVWSDRSERPLARHDDPAQCRNIINAERSLQAPTQRFIPAETRRPVERLVALARDLKARTLEHEMQAEP